MSHMDILMTRQYESQGETKTAYTKVGVAFPLQNGGFRLRFEAIPVPTMYDGKIECSMLMVEPKPRDQQGQQQSNQGQQQDYGSAKDGEKPSADEYAKQSGGAPANFADDMNDEVPFMMEWR